MKPEYILALLAVAVVAYGYVNAQREPTAKQIFTDRFAEKFGPGFPFD